MTTVLAPLTFRNGVAARNRVVLAAMTNSQSHADGTLSNEELRWLTMRAEGGFGVVMTCASHVAKDGQGWPGELGCFDDAHIPGLGTLASSLGDAVGLVQIFHGGLRADEKVSGAQPWGPSAVEGGRGATEADLERVIAQFGDAAVRCVKAGFHGVEIHGAHGYLLTQFLSTVQNQRTDRWGGSLDNRARLVREVTRAVRARVPASFVVGVRLSPEDFGNARGLDLDETIHVARWLAEDGADFIHVSLWDASLNTKKYPDRHALPLFRAALPDDVRLLAAGKVWTAADAEAMLARGADGVAIARAAILNADWPERITVPSWEPMRPPVTRAYLRTQGLSEPFIDYMKQRPSFVVD